MQRSIFNSVKPYEAKTTTDAAGNITWKLNVVMERYYSFIDDDIKKFQGNERLTVTVNSKHPVCLVISATYHTSDTNLANQPLDAAIRNLFSMLNRHSGVTSKDYVGLVGAHEDFLHKNAIQSDYHAKIKKQHGANYRPHGNAY